MLEMGVGNVEGTGFRGYMPGGITYQNLVKVFGEPNGDVTENYKIDVEWFGTIDGEIFTIYNYKTGRSYLKEGGKPVEKMSGTDWHIGGGTKTVVKKLVEYLLANLEQIKAIEEEGGD